MSCFILILFTHVASRTKSKGLLIDVLFYSCTFYTRNVFRLLIDDHYTFYTQKSSAYEKQGASIYLYPSFRYSEKPFSYKFIS
jgi:hypothetical protein